MSTQQEGAVSLKHLTGFGIAGLIVVLGVGIGMLGCETRETPDARSDVEGETIETASLPPLVASEIHSGLGYALDDAAEKKLAPRVFVDNVDFNLNRIRDVEEKKRTFFRIMLPLIARENDRIRAERQKLLDNPGPGAAAPLYQKYDVEPGNREELLKRVDVVPASLVLAKAALESGWGTSRFARKGNNYFGMRTYNDDTPGIEPKKAEGFKVIRFKSIGHGVRSYLKNMNTNEAYTKLRDARARDRAKNGAPRGRPLTNYLDAYSEIPEKYGKRLRNVMDINDLDRFDGVRLAKN